MLQYEENLFQENQMEKVESDTKNKYMGKSHDSLYVPLADVVHEGIWENRNDAEKLMHNLRTDLILHSWSSY